MGSELLDLVQGAGRFVDDVIPEGTLRAVFVRSTIAHGMIESIDIPPVPPDVTVHTAETLGAPDIPVQLRHNAPTVVMPRPALAHDRVRYVGEPVAVVLASSSALAVDVVEDVWVDIDPLPVVIDPADAVRDEVLLFPDAATNVVHRSVRGAGDSPLPDAPVVVDIEVTNRRLAAVPIEPLACMAIPHADHVEVWCGSQVPHRLRRQLSLVFGRPEEFFRVVVPDVGGGFGIKGPIYPEYVAVVAAALAHGRPVLWRERRRESFSGGVHGRGIRHRVRLAGDRAGRLLALRIEVLGDVGAYPHFGFVPVETAASIGAGPYAIEDVGVVATSVVTNLAPTGPYRGAGRPEGSLAIERAIEVYARRIGRDPVEVRLANMLAPDQLPVRTPTGSRYDSGDYAASLRLACEHIDVAGFRSRQEERRRQGGNPIGIGIASFVEPAGGPPDSGEYVSVEIDPQGTVVARTGSTSTGQRHAEVWRRVVGEMFEIDPGKVVIVTGDTALVPDGEGTFGSRSTQITVSGLTVVGERVINKAKELAAELLEASPQDMVLAGGGFAVVGSPGATVSLAEVAALADEKGISLREDEFHRLGGQTFSYGTHAAEVEVDVETGEVRVTRIVAVDDAGVILDHAGAEGQVVGGLAQGIGQALYEAVEYDEAGQIVNGSLMGYLVPHATDIPPVELIEMTTPAPVGVGAKGVGESGVIGAPIAILNATLDALEPYGVEDLSLPLTPAKVWAAIRQAQAQIT